jgi:hypothetical protein
MPSIIIETDVTAQGSINSIIRVGPAKTANSILRVETQHSRPFSAEDCPVVAVEVVGFSPDKVIRQVDYQNSIFANAPDFCVIERLAKVSGVYPIYEYPFLEEASGIIQYLVTDLAANAHTGKELFYQYELLYDAYLPDLENSLSLYKNGDVIIDKNSYSLQFSSDLLENHARYSKTDWSSGILEDTDIRRTRLLLPTDFNDINAFYTIKYTKSLYNSKTFTEELIELEPIYYQDIDFEITNSGLTLLPNSAIPSNTENLYLLKDPEKRIYSKGLSTIKDIGYQTEQTSSWKLKLNTGAFISRPSIFGTASGIAYKLGDVYGTGYIPIVSSKSRIVRDDIIKVDDVPIYVDTSKYTYPRYQIDIYDKSTENFNDAIGKIAIDINGKSQTNLTIKCVDRKKGYILFNGELNRIDELEVAHYIKMEDSLFLEKLELNPKIPLVSGVDTFHILDYPEGAGIALRPYDSNDSDTEYPYIYDASSDESSRICYQITDIGASGISVNWSGNFFKIAELYLNHLTPDILKITDARTVGGGVNLNNIQNDIARERKWYTNIGYYGGEPLPHNSNIIIHIPRASIDSLRNQWINYALETYDNTYDGTTQGTQLFNSHLDQVIRRYISAGSDYILIPTEVDGTFSGILNLEN